MPDAKPDDVYRLAAWIHDSFRKQNKHEIKIKTWQKLSEREKKEYLRVAAKILCRPPEVLRRRLGTKESNHA